ncbi:MAG: Uma2 family endonuclease [Chloroflexaceae bacterium]|jgi:Uma2 family endonuclease|nr:Uma2 family endonuclease [Chloroflexaceae bacterium]
MTAQPQSYTTEAEYLAFERASSTRHEYYNGRVYAMAGATEAHNLIAGNVIAALHGQLRAKPCRVYPSDMRVKVRKTGLNTYPDVIIVCGQPEFVDDTGDTITNPIVIVEILSPSTERYDRGMKFQHYRTIATLQEYLLIAQDHHRIEHFSRQSNGLWQLQEAVGLEEQIVIRAIDCILALADVYEKVELQPDAEDEPPGNS